MSSTAQVRVPTFLGNRWARAMKLEWFIVYTIEASNDFVKPGILCRVDPDVILLANEVVQRLLGFGVVVVAERHNAVFGRPLLEIERVKRQIRLHNKHPPDCYGFFEAEHAGLVCAKPAAGATQLIKQNAFLREYVIGT